MAEHKAEIKEKDMQIAKLMKEKLQLEEKIQSIQEDPIAGKLLIVTS